MTKNTFYYSDTHLFYPKPIEFILHFFHLNSILVRIDEQKKIGEFF